MEISEQKGNTKTGYPFSNFRKSQENLIYCCDRKRITLSKSTFCLKTLNSLCRVKAEDDIHNKRTRSSSTLYCRQLESGISTGLKLNEGYFEAPSVLSKEGEKEINC